jgi:2-alkyl-3-oxoalkanoate reductase
MRIFVAGGTGVIGRHLVPQLIEAGHHVTVMTRRSDRAEALKAIGAEAVSCDVFHAQTLGEVVGAAKPDAIVHQLTSLPRTIDPRKIGDQFAANDRIRVEGTKNLVAAAVAAGVEKMVAQSIAFVYEPVGGPVKDESDPLWLAAPEPFLRSVAAADVLERTVTTTTGIAGVVLRYGYFYGPDTSYAPSGQIADMVRRRRFPIVGDGGGIYSMVHVDDAARAAVAGLGPVEPGVYNVVDDEPAPVRDWLPRYAAVLGAPSPWHVPRFVARAVAGPHAVYLMTEQRGASNAKARQSLGWTPTYPTWQKGFDLALG